MWSDLISENSSQLRVTQVCFRYSTHFYTSDPSKVRYSLALINRLSFSGYTKHIIIIRCNHCFESTWIEQLTCSSPLWNRKSWCFASGIKAYHVSCLTFLCPNFEKLWQKLSWGNVCCMLIWGSRHTRLVPTRFPNFDFKVYKIHCWLCEVNERF